MNELIKELKSLISPQGKKGTTGYVVLAKSERVTAHKISVIINKLESTKGASK